MVEVELVQAGPVDLYISDNVLEFLMSYRTWDPIARESVFTAARALALHVSLGLRIAPAVEDLGDGIFYIEVASNGKIVGFFSGEEDFIGVEYAKSKRKQAVRVSKTTIQAVLKIKTLSDWRARQ